MRHHRISLGTQYPNIYSHLLIPVINKQRRHLNKELVFSKKPVPRIPVIGLWQEIHLTYSLPINVSISHGLPSLQEGVLSKIKLPVIMSLPEIRLFLRN
jgi:hypothetical protein